MVTRVEYSTRYLLKFDVTFDLTPDVETQIISSMHDKMTQCRYSKPVESFSLETKVEEIYEVDVMKEGREALERANAEMGMFGF